jgi:outer membrane protein
MKLSKHHITIAAFCLATSVHAADLMDAWQAAQNRDPELAAARTLLEQAAFRKDQAAALWEPRAVATVQAGTGFFDTSTKGAQAMGQSDVSFNTNANVGVMTRASVGAQKPWLSPEREAQSKQLALSADIAQAQWQHTEQTLMLRTAQKYVDVLSEELTLGVLQRQQKTLQQAAKEISNRQSIGDASTMDVQEASARVSDMHAQVLSQENRLAMKRVAYQQLVGLEPTQLATLPPSIQVTPANLGDVNQWVQRAKTQSPTLSMMRLQQAVQAQEAKRIHAGNATTLDWVAQAQLDRLMGHGMYGTMNNQATQVMVGVQLQTPLGKNNWLAAREGEALKQVEKLRFDEEAAFLQIEQSVRDAWQNISTAAQRMSALEQSRKASQARLLATRNAHRTGARTTNEWLGAENDAAQAELALLQLRLQTVMERLRLQAASGTLDASVLQSINALLKNVAAH